VEWSGRGRPPWSLGGLGYSIEAAKADGMSAVGLTSTHPVGTLVEAGADEVVENLAGYNVARLLERLKSRAEG